MKETKLVLSLPPFNIHGMNKYIENENIEYVTLRDAIKEVIKSAKQEIVISSPFLELRGIRDVEDLLFEQIYNGIQVKILVREALDEKNSRHAEIIRLIEKSKELKIDERLEIREYHYSKDPKVYSSLHAKFVIADSNYGYMGSGELRTNSVEKNFESGILAQNKIITDIHKIFEKIWLIAKVFSYDK